MAGIMLLAGCMLYTTGSFVNTMKSFGQHVIGSVAISITRSSSNVLGYLNYRQHSVEGNVIVQALSQMYPYQLYLAHQDDVDLRQYIEQAKLEESEGGDIEKQKIENIVQQFLFYNGSRYGGNGTQNQMLAQESIAEIEGTTDVLVDQNVTMVNGETYFEEDEDLGEVVDVAAINTAKNKLYSIKELSNYDFLIRNCYIQEGTIAEKTLFDGAALLKKDMTMELTSKKPQILIYHTHSQEAFVDSREGVVEDTVVGVGAELARILEEDYGINVIHDTTTYDLVDGKLERSMAYAVALPSLEKILEYNPSIEVIIDLHRDEGKKRVTTINGEKCAKIMFFNGLSRNLNGPIEALPNPYLEDNLAFSLQLYLSGKSTFPDLFMKNYLKGYRYNMHLRARSLLIELGTVNNTVQEEKNTMKYLAKILYDELTTKQESEK